MPYDLSSNNEAKPFYMYKKGTPSLPLFTSQHQDLKSWNFELSTIASEEVWDESVHMWNLDRAFSPKERLWKLRILASIQTKYCRWFIPKMKINSYDFNSNCYDFNSKYWLFEEKILHAQIKLFFRGAQLWQLCFYSWWGEREDPNTIKSVSSLARQRSAI